MLLPPPPPDTQVQVGVVSFVGVKPLTEGALGAVVFDGKTPLDVAHESRAGDLVEWLLASGAKRAVGETDRCM